MDDELLTAAVPTPKCVDRFGWTDKTNFVHRSCSMCYYYLFQNTKSLYLSMDTYAKLAKKSISAFSSSNTNKIADSASHNYGNDSGYFPPAQDAVYPNPDDPDSMDYVCNTLENRECSRWTACCTKAVECCDSQLNMPVGLKAGHCPRVWDGYNCWADTVANTQVYTGCPWFIEHGLTTREAVKECTENATWFTKNGTEWTDYTNCVESDMVGVYLTVCLSVASILLLVPGAIILSVFKDLRKQHRIRLHIQLFIALTASAISYILWYMLVHRDVVINSVSVFNTNPVWCRILSFFKIYLSSVTYMWMFCEGYYLHRLITKAFEPPKTLIPLYALGWGLPVIPITIYAILRGVIANESCWARSYGHIQWIYYVPNLVCLLTNLIFLCNILRILLFQLHSHPHEPNNFRRGLKAVFMLIPLFGLQLFLTIYRPQPGAPGSTGYEYFQYIITSSQGIFVSLIFCFFNGEVISQLAKYFKCCRSYSRKMQAARRQSVQMTQVTSAEDCRSHTSSSKSPRPSISNGGSTSPIKINKSLISNGGSGYSAGKDEEITMVPIYKRSSGEGLTDKDALMNENPGYYVEGTYNAANGKRTVPIIQIQNGNGSKNGGQNNHSVKKVKYSMVNTVADS